MSITIDLMAGFAIGVLVKRSLKGPQVVGSRLTLLAIIVGLGLQAIAATQDGLAATAGAALIVIGGIVGLALQAAGLNWHLRRTGSGARDPFVKGYAATCRSTSSRKRLLFVTNLAHDDRLEDLLLAKRLADDWTVTIADANDAANIADMYDYALIRNAWPSFEFDDAFSTLEALVRAGRLRTYNPPSRSRGFHEDKSYLTRLYQNGYPVIPSFATSQELAAFDSEWATCAVYKPLNSCAGIGIEKGHVESLPQDGGIYQPWLAFQHEVSLFFIDNNFAYALRSASHEERWVLTEFEPSSYDLDWAMRFIRWNNLSFGIQRIDGGRTADGRLWLTEVEDFLPCLSLILLQDARRAEVLARLLDSVKKNLIN